MYGYGKKIVVDNTLDERLRILEEQVRATCNCSNDC